MGYSHFVKFITIFTLLFKLSVAQAVNYYVKPTGSNTNNGTSYATAFKTIQKALSVASPGTTIYVGAGTYKERLSWTTSGTATAPISLTCYNNDVVYVSGATGGTNTAQNALMLLSNKSNVRVSNIRFLSNYRAGAIGIQITGSGSGIYLTNCQIYNIGWTTSVTAYPSSSNNANGITVVGSSATAISDLKISGCQIYNCITGYSEALTLVGNVDNFLLENNIVRDITNIGIVLAGHYSWTGAPAAVNQTRNGIVRNNTVYNCVSQVAVSAGIYVDGGKNILVERNKCYQNSIGISAGCENDGFVSRGITFRNNLIYNNKDVGMYLGSNAPNSLVDSCKVINNTFFQNYSAGVWGAEIAVQNSSNTLIQQNIFVPRTDLCVAVGIWGYTTSNYNANYNLYWRTNGNIATMVEGVSAGTNAIYGNPKFTSTTLPTPNLHLLTSSLAINAGNPAFVPAMGELDYDGQARVLMSRVDIGADETILSVMPTENNLNNASLSQENDSALMTNTMLIYPNPVASTLFVKLPENEVGSIWISDLLGNLFDIKELNQIQEMEFQIANYTPGVYFIHLKTQSGIQTLKFIKR